MSDGLVTNALEKLQDRGSQIEVNPALLDLFGGAPTTSEEERKKKDKKKKKKKKKKKRKKEEKKTGGGKKRKKKAGGEDPVVPREFGRLVEGQETLLVSSESSVAAAMSQDENADAAHETEHAEGVPGTLGSTENADVEEAKAVGIVSSRREEKEKQKKKKSSVSQTVFVGNIPVSLIEMRGQARGIKMVKKEFGKYGKVQSVRFRSIPFASVNRPRKVNYIEGNVSNRRKSMNAYVVFDKPKAARKAVKQANGTLLEGHHIRVDFAAKPKEKGIFKKEPGYTLFVGNVPFDAEDEELWTLFGHLGIKVTGVRLIRDPKTAIGKGFGYVTFKHRAVTQKLIKKKKSEEEKIFLRDRELRFQASEQKSKAVPVREKRKKKEHYQGSIAKKQKTYANNRKNKRKRKN